jgi:small conductance mechanosensitive channel
MAKQPWGDDLEVCGICVIQGVRKMVIAEFWEKVFEEVPSFLPQLVGGLAVLLAFWTAGVLTARIIGRLCRARALDPDITALLSQSVKVGLLLLGIVSALGTVGINVAPLVAGFGLTGLALGLALKEVLSNATAGFLILLYKPFKRDDQIAVLSFQGRVTEVNLRFTTLASDGLRIFIPNTLLLTNTVLVGTTQGLVPTPSPLAPPAIPKGA